MIQLGSTILSLDIIEKKFACNYTACKGICCVEGDSGAPIQDKEIAEVEKALPYILSLLDKKNQDAIKTQGVFYLDTDKEKVTTLVNNKECAFVINKNGSYSCAIAKAWQEGKSTLQKPISCHLYPIRVKSYKDFEGLHYELWHICKDAVCKGEKNKTKVFEFCKSALVRKYGDAWYAELETIAMQWEQESIKNNLNSKK